MFVHARDPYVRVDVLPSSRRVEVFIGDTLVADTARPRLLFETSLPVRYYVLVSTSAPSSSPAPTPRPPARTRARRRICRSPGRTTATPSRTPPGTTRSRRRRLRVSATMCRSTQTGPGSLSTASRWRAVRRLLEFRILTGLLRGRSGSVDCVPIVELPRQMCNVHHKLAVGDVLKRHGPATTSSSIRPPIGTSSSPAAPRSSRWPTTPGRTARTTRSITAGAMWPRWHYSSG